MHRYTTVYLRMHISGYYPLHPGNIFYQYMLCYVISMKSFLNRITSSWMRQFIVQKCVTLKTISSFDCKSSPGIPCFSSFTIIYQNRWLEFSFVWYAMPKIEASWLCGVKLETTLLWNRKCREIEVKPQMKLISWHFNKWQYKQLTKNTDGNVQTPEIHVRCNRRHVVLPGNNLRRRIVHVPCSLRVCKSDSTAHLFFFLTISAGNDDVTVMPRYSHVSQLPHQVCSGFAIGDGLSAVCRLHMQPPQPVCERRVANGVWQLGSSGRRPVPVCVVLWLRQLINTPMRHVRCGNPAQRGISRADAAGAATARLTDTVGVGWTGERQARHNEGWRDEFDALNENRLLQCSSFRGCTVGYIL